MGKFNVREMMAPKESNTETVDRPRTVEQIAVEINFYKAQTVQNIIEIGRRLIEAKERLPHGAWADWLKDAVEFSQQTATNFMNIAKQYGNSQPVGNLSYTKLIALLQVPEEDREAFLAESHLVNGVPKTVAEMSKRELEQAIRERDQARKEAAEQKARAKREYDNYMNALVAKEKADERLKIAEGEAAAQRKRAERAQRCVDDLQGQVIELQHRPVEVAVAEVSEEQIEEIRQQEKAKAEQKYCGQITAERRRAEAAEQKLRQQPVRSEAAYTAEEADDAWERFAGALWSSFEQFTALLSRTEGTLALNALKEAAEEIDEIRQEIRLMSNQLISQQEIDLPPDL